MVEYDGVQIEYTISVEHDVLGQKRMFFDEWVTEVVGQLGEAINVDLEQARKTHLETLANGEKPPLYVVE